MNTDRNRTVAAATWVLRFRANPEYVFGMQFWKPDAVDWVLIHAFGVLDNQALRILCQTPKQAV